VLKHYSNGKLNDLSEEWYKNGQLFDRSNYKNGKLDGLSEEWYKNGQLFDRSN
jgi:antitoxin component YwqK of YwqJK toxin-antitoxin module